MYKILPQHHNGLITKSTRRRTKCGGLIVGAEGAYSRFSEDEGFVRKAGVYPPLRRGGVLGRMSTAPPEAWGGLVTPAPTRSRTKDTRRRAGPTGSGAPVFWGGPPTTTCPTRGPPLSSFEKDHGGVPKGSSMVFFRRRSVWGYGGHTALGGSRGKPEGA